MEKYTEVKDILFSLCRSAAVSGNEGDMYLLCKSLLPKSAEVSLDRNGSIVAVLGNKDAKDALMFDAHIDQIGMRVTNVGTNGFLKAEKCGGTDSRVLQGSAVIVHAKREIPAIITCTPPHLSSGREDKASSLDKLWIDTGLPQAEVSRLVSEGDSVTLYSEPKELLKSRVSALACDNRAGAAALIRAAHLLDGKRLDKKLVLLFSSREETNALGAKTAAFSYEASECICVDVSFAKQPFGGYPSQGKFGAGAMICVSPTLNREMTRTLFRIAEKENIPCQTEVCAGTTGTNADHISVAKGGIKTALLSIPEENMHTQGEIVDLSDIENTALLLAAFAQHGGSHNV